ncbi:MAG: hypothetical protein IJH73_00830 [Lachnospiraceae bacterium]|nr:hypothetical protein [Lachnospiraceae bacterium]
MRSAEEDLFLKCSSGSACDELQRYPNGRQMQQLSLAVRDSMAGCFRGEYDAVLEIDFAGRKYGYRDFFDYFRYGLSFEEACRAVIAAFNDCPLAYFANTYTVFGNTENGSILYALADEYRPGAERKRVSAEIEAQIREIAGSIPPDLPDREKAERVYRRMCGSSEYDTVLSSVNYVDIPAHSAAGWFIGRKAVCEGLSKAYQSIMLYLGVECLTFGGICYAYDGERNRKPTRHAWNFVKIDHSWRIVDVTEGVCGGNGFLVPEPHAIYRDYREDERDTHASVYQYPAPDFI